MRFSCDQSGAVPCDIRVRGVAKARIQDRSGRAQTHFPDEPESDNPLDLSPAALCTRVKIGVPLRPFDLSPTGLLPLIALILSVIHPVTTVSQIGPSVASGHTRVAWIFPMGGAALKHV